MVGLVKNMSPKPSNGLSASESRKLALTKFEESLTNLSKDRLPICEVKQEFLQKYAANTELVVIGETGCGKTTQIPKFIYEYYATRNFQQPFKVDKPMTKRLIGVTQPRRVAATSIATRVAQELNQKIGDLVGYQIRFEDKTSVNTRIKYMTDGILLREAIADPTLSKYSVIILDEAHERTIHTDVLFGVIKKAQKMRRLRDCKRKHWEKSNGNSMNGDSGYGESGVNGQAGKIFPLKIIVMSATMDVDHFRQYFNNAPALYVMGRTYPIEISYAQEKITDYVRAALVTVFQIHETEHEIHEASRIGGDIIVFCTGQEEIEGMVRTVEELSKEVSQYRTPSGIEKTLKPYPLYAALPNGLQKKVFDRPDNDCFRRVIFATNIAETSVTIPNVRFVVDTGKVKSRVYSSRTNFEVMLIEDVSRAQASQRAGRAGRTAPGKCFRLYTKAQFKQMRAFPIPEIQKCNLSSVLLQIVALGVSDIRDFDFVDKPTDAILNSAIDTLIQLKAIEEIPPKLEKVSSGPKDVEMTDISLKNNENKKVENSFMNGIQTPSTSSSLSSSSTPSSPSSSTSKHYKLTELGNKLVKFPVDVKLAAVIVAAEKHGCLEEVVTIVAMLSVDNVFNVPNNEREKALKIQSKFSSTEGDLIKHLNVYRKYKESKQNVVWCHDNYLKVNQLKQAIDIRGQLMDVCKMLNMNRSSTPNTEVIRKCFALAAGPGIGLGANVAMLQKDGNYKILNNLAKTNHYSENSDVHIHPSSCLFEGNVKPECVLFIELVHTTKSYMRIVTLVDAKWFTESDNGFLSTIC